MVKYSRAPESPNYQAFPVTPSDVNDLVYPAKSLYIAATGDVAVFMLGAGSNPAMVTFPNAQQGTTLPIQVSRVLSTGTSATVVAYADSNGASYSEAINEDNNQIFNEDGDPVLGS